MEPLVEADLGPGAGAVDGVLLRRPRCPIQRKATAAARATDLL